MISLVITIGRLLSAVYRAIHTAIYSSFWYDVLSQTRGWNWIDSFFMHLSVSFLPV